MNSPIKQSWIPGHEKTVSGMTMHEELRLCVRNYKVKLRQDMKRLFLENGNTMTWLKSLVAAPSKWRQRSGNERLAGVAVDLIKS